MNAYKLEITEKCIWRIDKSLSMTPLEGVYDETFPNFFEV